MCTMLAPKKPCGLNRVMRACKEGAIVVLCDVLPIMIVSAFVLGVEFIGRIIIYVCKRHAPEIFGILALITLWRVRSGAKFCTHTNSDDDPDALDADIMEKGHRPRQRTP